MLSPSDSQLKFYTWCNSKRGLGWAGAKPPFSMKATKILRPVLAWHSSNENGSLVCFQLFEDTGTLQGSSVLDWEEIKTY